MPLIKSASREAIGENIKEMEASGHPRDQAIAAALDTARRAKRKKGGKLYRDAGGSADDEAAMMPETFVPAGVRDWVKQAAPQDEALLEGAGRSAIDTLAAPGRALVSDRPISTDEMVKPAADIAGLTTLGAGAIPAEADALRMGIKAYHGSPHDFDRFDMGKIGTGEGAQAYGHGLYFADNENVAKSYREGLSGAPDPIHDQAKLALDATNGDRVAAQKRLLNQAHFAEEGPEANAYRGAAELIASGAEPRMPGHMYEVDINADPAHFLDWDKPLSEQHQTVQEIIAPMIADEKALGTRSAFLAGPGEPTGQNIYSAISPTTRQTIQSRLGPYDIFPPNPSVASNALREAGIPGIKYLDQGSRGAGEGSHNYVVFDDSLINIMRKYGIPGLLAAGITGQGREDHMADGGAVQKAIAIARRARGGKVHVGPIRGDTPGRTDVKDMKVPDGSYVLPAEFVSHMGENNTEAGLKAIERWLSKYDTPNARSRGGATGGKPVDCVTAAGEYSIPPHIVAALGGGDVDRGHKILDSLVMLRRNDHIRSLKHLAPPAQD